MAPRAHLGQARADGVAAPRGEDEAGPGHHLVGAQGRAPIGEAELVGDTLLGALRSHDRDPFEYACELAAVGVGVHAHRTTDRARDVHAELDPGQAELGGARGHRGQPGPASAQQRGLPPLDGGEPAVELDHQPAHAGVGHQQVRPRPDDVHGEAVLPRPSKQPLDLLLRARPSEVLGRPARPHRGQSGEAVVGHDRGRRPGLLDHAGTPAGPATRRMTAAWTRV